MIEVYKTNVRTHAQASRIIGVLQDTFRTASINFDLADCDRILRIEGITASARNLVIHDLMRLGFRCEVLD